MTIERYARSAIVLHWAIALLLLFQLGLGWRMTSMGNGAAAYAAFQFHKSIGIAVLALSLLRIAIRLVKPRPAPVEAGAMAGLLVRLVHFGLYGFMIGGPLTGWVVVSTAEVVIPTRLFGTVPWPHLPIGQAWNDLASESHEALAWIGLGLIAVHIAGAIRHHLGGAHENVVGRMIPMISRPGRARLAIPAALAAAGLLGLGFLAPWLLYREAPAMTEAVANEAPPPAVQPDAPPPAVLPEAPAPEEPAVEKPAENALAVQAVSPASWKVQDGGRLGFVASMNGAAIDGQFDNWNADILFDADALPQSRITVRVPLLSANTANGDRDSMLRGPDFFGDAGTAIYRSTTIRHLGGERYTAAGTLSMNGVSRPVTLAFTLHIDSDLARVAGSTKLDRTAFGIGAGQWAATDQIAANVDVNFRFSARRQ